MALGILAFLRAPLEGTTRPTRQASWPRWTASRSEARAAPRADPVDAAPATSRALVSAKGEAPTRERGPYFFSPPSDLTLHALRLPEARPIADLIESRLTMLEDYGDSAAGRDVLFLLGAEHQAAGDSEGAAEFFEAFATHPRAAACEEGGGACSSAAAALENAMLFRREAGQIDRAQATARIFRQRFERAYPRAATRVAFAAARLKEDLDAEVAAYERLRERRLPPAERIQVEVAFGNAQWQRDRTRALRAFRRANRVWRRSGGDLMSTSPGLSPLAWVSELGRTREALAEARFRVANLCYEAAARLAPPPYRGPATDTHARKWTERHLRPWVQRRLRRIRRAEHALDEVDALGLSRWSVASAARRGQPYQDLADALRGLALPEVLETPGDETMAGIAQYREPVHRHLVQPAIDRFEACLHTARRTHAYGEWSLLCTEGLSRYDPRHEAPMALGPRGGHVAQD